MRRGYAVAHLQLPVAPDGMPGKEYLDRLRAELESYLSAKEIPGIITCHGINLVQAKRGGYSLPVGSLYVDGSNVVRMVASGEGWFPTIAASTTFNGGYAE